MSNVVGDIINDVLLRIQDPTGKYIYSPVMVLRAMNRVYGNLNEESHIITREWEIDFSSPGANDSVTDGYFALQDDFIYPYQVRTSGGYWFDYVSPEVFINTSFRRFTIDNGRIYFTNVDSDSAFVVKYFSSGKTLVNKSDADVNTDTEVNDPEYPKHLKDILMYGAAIDLSVSHPQYQYDLAKFNDLQVKMKRYAKIKDFSSPQRTGPRELTAATDAYGLERVY